MPADPAASIAGVSIRVTRLDEEGNLLKGKFDSYTTSAFIRVSFTPEYEEGDEITEKAADGTVCVSYKAPDTLKRVNMEIAICNPDPELSNLLSGGLLLSGPQGGKEVSLGWASAQVGEDPSGNGVAVEVWSKAIQNGKPANDNPYFHWVFPFVKTRLSGDRVIENGLLATTFEGYGVGNLNFRNGPDQMWRWPAAADRPYLYARSPYAPQGLNGFYSWGKGLIDPTSGEMQDAPQEQSGGDAFTNIVGINVKGGRNPYPYLSGRGEDAVLSAQDYLPDASGQVDMSAAADGQTVKNVPPADGTKGMAYVQNPVTYKEREAVKAAAAAGDKFPAEVTITGSDTANAQKLAGLGFAAVPQTKWAPGEAITIGTAPNAFQFHWDGTAWQSGPAPNIADAGDVFPAEATVTLQDAANAGKLNNLHYVPRIKTAWAPGEFITIGTLKFTWDGNDWAPGDGYGNKAQAAPTAPNNVFSAEPTVIAQDATNAAKLAALGYVAVPQTAWTTGQKITIGRSEFHWDGAAWAPGATP